MAIHQMTRRGLLRAGALGAGAAALAASPLRSTRAADGGTLRVYFNPGHNYKSYQAVIKQFEKDHAGWKVDMEFYQWPDMRTKILADFAAGNPPDICADPGGWTQEFALAGNLKSLQPYVARDGKETGFPGDWQEYTVNRNTLKGEIYGVQIHLTCILLIYNTKMLQDAGIAKPPANWEEFLAAAKATAKNNIFGFAPNQDQSYTWPWLLQNKVEYYDPAKNVVPMDTPDAAAAMQYQADLIHKYKVAPVPIASADYEGPQKLFSAKRTAMILTGPWDIKPIETGSPDLDWGIAQALTGQVQATSAAGTSLMIPAKAKQPDLAWDLIMRLTTLQTEIATTKETGVTMPRKSWAASPEIKAMPRIAAFAQGLTYAEDTSAKIRLTGNSGQIDDLFKQMYQEVIYRNKPATEALKDFTSAANKILAGSK